MEIRKRFHFEAAHRLWNHPGRCAGVHGHSYVVEVFVKGDPDPTTGMVADFGWVKKIAGEFIDKFDHALIFHSRDPILGPHRNDEVVSKATSALLEALNPRWVMVPYMPTAEMMASHFLWHLRRQQVGPYINFTRVRVHETETGFAECDSLVPCQSGNYADTVFSRAVEEGGK
jgi:6-pyruvoyltetrahydropterin/6-carboxytetrahydropterin synthase